MNPLLFFSFMAIILASAVACAIGMLILAHPPQTETLLTGALIANGAGLVGTIATLLFRHTILQKDA